jgi:hypothetical protein
VHQAQVAELPRDRLEIAEVVRHQRQAMNQAARRDPEIVDAATFQAMEKPSVELSPPVYDASIARNHDASSDRRVKCCPRTPAHPATDSADLELANDREWQRQRVPANESRKFSASSTTVVHEREGARVHGQRPQRNIARIHLQLSKDGHERVALVIGGIGVIEASCVDGLACALLASKVLERPFVPELL